MVPGKRLTLCTPEGVTFSHPVAGVPSRAMAACTDQFIVWTLSLVLGKACSMLMLLGEDVATATYILLDFAVWTLYGIACEWRLGGRTLGKMMLRLRVVDIDGLRLSFPQVLLRNLSRTVDMLPMFYLAGGLSCFLNKGGARLGDILARTAVIREPKIRELEYAALTHSKYNSLAQHPVLASRLRQSMSAPETRLVALALARREILEPASRVALYARMASRFRERVPYPPGELDTVPDEVYLGNLLEVVASQGRRIPAGSP